MKHYLFILLFFFSNHLTWAKNCQWEAVKDSQTMEWTAFKTSKKVGVKGTFKDFKIVRMKNDNKDSSSLKEWLENYGFAINVNSVDTKNSQRDKTLVDSFFSLFATTINYLPKDKFITGQTLQVIGPKKIIAQLDLNGMKKEVPVTYEYAQEWLKITGSIDLLDFQLHKAHATLHKACYELHKGEDGVSKTWTQVDFEGKIKIHKTCK